MGTYALIFDDLAQTTCLMKSGVDDAVGKEKDNIFRLYGLWNMRVRAVASQFHFCLIFHTTQFSLIMRLLRLAWYVASYSSHLA